MAPGDYSPDVDPQPIPGQSLLIRLQQDIVGTTEEGPGTIHNQVARELDEAALRPCTGDFAPGFEVSFGGRGEVRDDIHALFYRSGRDEFIDPREIRVRYRDAAGGPGAVLGAAYQRSLLAMADRFYCVCRILGLDFARVGFSRRERPGRGERLPERIRGYRSLFRRR